MARMKTNRSVIAYILLTLITFGIYGLYTIHAIARDTNILCHGDGKHTRGLIGLWFFSLITCGIYPLFWYYGLGERLSYACHHRGIHCNISGGSLLLWMIVGAMLCGLGPFIALHQIFSALNKLSA